MQQTKRSPMIDKMPESPIKDWPKNMRKMIVSHDTLVLDGVKNPFHYMDEISNPHYPHGKVKNIIIDGKNAVKQIVDGKEKANRFIIHPSVEQLTVMNFTRSLTIKFSMGNDTVSSLNTLNILNCTEVTLINYVCDHIVHEIINEAKLSNLHTFRLVSSTIYIERLFHRLMPELRHFITSGSSICMPNRHTVDGRLLENKFSTYDGCILVKNLSVPLSIEYVNLDIHHGRIVEIITPKGKSKSIEFPSLTYDNATIRGSFHIMKKYLPYQFTAVLEDCIKNNTETYGKRLSPDEDITYITYLTGTSCSANWWLCR